MNPELKHFAIGTASLALGTLAGYDLFHNLEESRTQVIQESPICFQLREGWSYRYLQAAYNGMMSLQTPIRTLVDSDDNSFIIDCYRDASAKVEKDPWLSTDGARYLDILAILVGLFGGVVLVATYPWRRVRSGLSHLVHASS